jgi:Domain of unknown function (DUF6285)
MRERPDGPALLAIARSTLLDALLPNLPAELALSARMVANAMAIAAREAQADSATEAALAARLRALVGSDEIGTSALLRALGQQIRLGLHDPGTKQHGAVREWLTEYSALRCAISNPRALGRPR